MTDHARTLQRLLDKEDIRDVIHAYCSHFDRGEPEAVVALFTEDALIDYGPGVAPMTGRAQLLPMVSKGMRDLFAATSHHVSNISIQFDSADQARSNCYLYAWHRYRGTERIGHLWGQYDHIFKRSDVGWKIAGLRLSAVASEGFHREIMHPIDHRSDTSPE